MVLRCLTATLLLAAADYDTTFAQRSMDRYDTDGDQLVSEEEAGKQWIRYGKLDQDGDGALSLEEMKKLPQAYLKHDGKRYLNLCYKQTAEEDLYVDLYLPRKAGKKPAPLLYYTHGGGWSAGSKHGIAGGSFSSVATALLEEGFAVASVNYRLCKKGRSVTMYECLEDCKDGLRFLIKDAKKYGIDPNAVYPFGDSAGGHLAQMMTLSSAESFVGDPSLAGVRYRVKAGVSWYGPSDFTRNELFSLDGVTDKRNRFLGRIFKPGEEVNKDAQRVKEISPIYYLSADTPPLYMMQADKDACIPVHHAYEMKKKADAVGADFGSVVVKDAGHNWRNVDAAETTPTRDEIIQMTIDYFLSQR